MNTQQYALVKEDEIVRMGPHPGWQNDVGFLSDAELLVHGFRLVLDEIPAHEPGSQYVTQLPQSTWAIEPTKVVATYQITQIPFEEMQAAAFNRINDAYNTRVSQLAEGYPAYERESWPLQSTEAAIVLGADDKSTPWIDASAATEGVTRLDLATRISNMDNAYRVIHGELSAIRRLKRNEIEAIVEGPDAAELLNAVQWPENP